MGLLKKKNVSISSKPESLLKSKWQIKSIFSNCIDRFVRQKNKKAKRQKKQHNKKQTKKNQEKK